MPRKKVQQRHEHLRPVLIPFVYLIVWSVGLSKYTATDVIRIYGIIDLSICCCILALQWLISSKYASRLNTLIQVSLFGIGYYLFKIGVGQSIFELFSMGAGKWLEYPFIIQVMYFKLWMVFVMNGFIITFFVMGLILAMFKSKTNQLDVKLNDSLPERVLAYAIPIQEDVVNFSSWIRREKLCQECFNVLGEGKVLHCGHGFHQDCYNGDICPVCNPVEMV